jgi:hypothetical protein
VAGDEIGQDVLATVAGLPPGRFTAAVAEAVAAGLLWRRPSEHPACGFVHALLGEAAYAEIDAEVRRGLHLELAAALEALPARRGGWTRPPITVGRRCRPATRRSWSIRRWRPRKKPCACSPTRQRWRSARPG